MQYIGVMTFAGSIIVLIFLLVEWIGKEHLEERQKYLLLKIALGFYLIPLVPIGIVYREMWLCLQNYLPALTNKELPHVEMVKYVIYHTDEGTIFNKNLDILMISTIVWLLVACTVLFVGTMKSVKQISRMVKCSSQTKNKKVRMLLEKYKADYGIRRKIDVYEYPVKLSPFTVGVLRPKIFVYAKENERDLEFALKHEMIHIKRNDVLIKQLANLVKYIHWFNPLVYFLRKRIEEICELACDERVIENADEQMRKDYARLILENASGSKEIKVAYRLSSDKIIEERISCIMRNEQKKKWNKVLVGSLMGVLVFTNSLTALANPSVTEVEEAVFEEEAAYQDDFLFVPVGEDKTYNVEVEEILYDEQFVDEQGNTYPVNSDEQIGTMTVCVHTYVNGTIQKHKVNSSGGCVVEEYSGKRCTKCGTVVWGDFLSSHTYAVCPH